MRRIRCPCRSDYEKPKGRWVSQRTRQSPKMSPFSPLYIPFPALRLSHAQCTMPLFGDLPILAYPKSRTQKTQKSKKAGSLVRSVKPITLPPPLIGHARLFGSVMLGFASCGYSHSEAASLAPRLIEGSLACYKLPLFSCTLTQATRAGNHPLPYSGLTLSA